MSLLGCLMIVFAVLFALAGGAAWALFYSEPGDEEDPGTTE